MPVIWLAAGSSVELPEHLLRGGGKVSHRRLGFRSAAVSDGWSSSSSSQSG
jgi:hypothetical protein